jgi:hypothetical protein
VDPHDLWPHIKLHMYWSLPQHNVQNVLALMVTVAIWTLLLGNSTKFQGPMAEMDGSGRHSIHVMETQMTLGIGQLAPRLYRVYISSEPKYILGVDILQGLCVNTTVGEFWLCIYVVKMVVQGHPHHPPVCMPEPTWIVHMK